MGCGRVGEGETEAKEMIDRSVSMWFVKGCENVKGRPRRRGVVSVSMWFVKGWKKGERGKLKRRDLTAEDLKEQD